MYFLCFCAYKLRLKFYYYILKLDFISIHPFSTLSINTQVSPLQLTTYPVTRLLQPLQTQTRLKSRPPQTIRHVLRTHVPHRLHRIRTTPQPTYRRVHRPTTELQRRKNVLYCVVESVVEMNSQIFDGKVVETFEKISNFIRGTLPNSISKRNLIAS